MAQSANSNRFGARVLIIALVLCGAFHIRAQTNQSGSGSTATGGSRPGGGGAQQIGGQPGGLQQEQEQRRRRQQQQRQQQQQTNPNINQPAASGQTQPQNQQQNSPQQQQNQQSPPNQQLGAPQNNNGSAPGEPSGATSPRANVGGDAVQLPNQNRQSTGAVRTLPVAPATLSLPEAVEIAIDNNLSTLLAAERINEAQGFLQQSRSFLLPNASGTAFQQNRTLNLAAQGISGGGGMMMGGIPSFVGPFNTFDARFNFSQTVLNLSAFRDFKSGKAAVRLAELNVELEREAVAVFVAFAYLNAQRSEQERNAAGADLNLAQSLLTLAQDQRNAGVASGVDVVRAESRVAQERLRVIQSEASREQARLDFERVVGLPAGSQTILTDMIMIRDETAPETIESIKIAVESRFEIKIADQTLQQREQDRRARVAELYPTLDAFGDYGDSASTPFSNNRATRAVGVRLNVPIFDGGFTRGRVKVAASQKRQAELQLGNARGQVEEDVRVALISLRLTIEQIRAAEEQFRLAERELQLATERFRAGVADNTEIISAQAGLANARALQVQAIAQYNQARLNFAAATGRAQTFRL